jgi:hypothetical protein
MRVAAATVGTETFAKQGTKHTRTTGVDNRALEA